MLLNEFQRIIDSIMPPSAAMRGDAIGLQVESRRGTAEKVLIALELTDDVLAEARSLTCDVVLVFHPLIYSPLASIRRDDRVGRLVAGLIEADIALVAVHTAFDAFPQGTNHAFAAQVGITVERPLVASDVAGYGMGIVGTTALVFDDLVSRIAQQCSAMVRYLPPPSSSNVAGTSGILRVAVVCGSGAPFMDEAVASGADVFITADLKYHAFHAADGHIGLIDPGHFEMEQFVPAGLRDALAPLVPDTCMLIRSTVSTNPVRYAGPLTIEHSSSL